jgi:fluoroquinolone transport system ATP-binding protein
LIAAQKAAGKTVFLTTHNMSLAQEICDRVAFIVDGRIRMIDSPRELMVRNGKRSVLVESRSPDGTLDCRRFSLEGLGDDLGFIGLLRSGNIETIHTEEASLEDVFVSVRGRRLE